MAAVVVFESADDGEQVGLDGAVHLGEAGAAVGFGAGNQCAGGVELLVVLRQELGGGDEQRAGQAGVGVWTRFLLRQTAISVGQSHFRARQVLFHPGGVGERTVGAGVDGLAANVDLLSAFSLFADGGVGEARVAGGHGMAGVVEQATHHFQRHVVVETGWRRCAGTGGV